MLERSYIVRSLVVSIFLADNVEEYFCQAIQNIHRCLDPYADLVWYPTSLRRIAFKGIVETRRLRVNEPLHTCAVRNCSRLDEESGCHPIYRRERYAHLSQSWIYQIGNDWQQIQHGYRVQHREDVVRETVSIHLRRLRNQVVVDL